MVTGEMSPYLLLGFLIATPQTGVDSILAAGDACCAAGATPGLFRTLCAIVLTLLIIFALIMKLFERFSRKEAAVEGAGYTFKGRK